MFRSLYVVHAVFKRTIMNALWKSGLSWSHTLRCVLRSRSGCGKAPFAESEIASLSVAGTEASTLRLPPKGKSHGMRCVLQYALQHSVTNLRYSMIASISTFANRQVQRAERVGSKMQRLCLTPYTKRRREAQMMCSAATPNTNPAQVNNPGR